MKQILKFAVLVAITGACSTEPEPSSPWSRQPSGGLPPRPAEATTPAASSTALPTDLEELVLLAQAESPAVQMSYHRWRQALEQVPQAEALPDPTVSLTTYLQEVETRVGPMDGRIGVSQRIPWFGKLDAAGDRAAALAEAEHAAVDAARLQVRSRVEVAWNRRVFLEQSLRFTEAQVELLRRVEDLTLKQVEVGRASQGQAQRAQIERLKMEDHVATLRDRFSVPEAQIDAAVGRRVAHQLAWQDAHYSDGTVIPSAQELPALLESASPRFQVLQARLSAADAAEEIADLDGMPDLRLGADWTWIGEGNPTMSDSGTDAFSVTLGVEIPLQRSRVDARRRAALAEQATVRADYRRQLHDLLAEAEGLRFAFADAQRRVTLYGQRLTPRAEDNFATTLGAYESGASSFQDLLDSAQTLFEFRLATARADSERADAIARFGAMLDLSKPSTEDQR
jgi:outer membrane protein TolC